MIDALSFSPTGGTDRVLSVLDEVFSFSSRYSLLKPIGKALEYDKDDVLFLFMPSYGGRAPEIAEERFRSSVIGNGARCVIVAVYGNRA